MTPDQDFGSAVATFVLLMALVLPWWWLEHRSRGR